ncbi:hypothetical protein F5B20DRAFT_261529 [Whalleya microplaca]|nr:hypothetical protein F5B20DRAFT_261529 [Whalleya microplaca]
MSSHFPTPPGPVRGKDRHQFRSKRKRFHRDSTPRQQPALGGGFGPTVPESQQNTPTFFPRHEDARPQENRNPKSTIKSEGSHSNPSPQPLSSNASNVNNGNEHQQTRPQEFAVQNQECTPKPSSKLSHSMEIDTKNSKATVAQVQDKDSYLNGWPADVRTAIQNAYERVRTRVNSTSPPVTRVYVVTYENQEAEVTYAEDGTTMHTVRSYDSQVIGAYSSLELATETALSFFKTQHLQFARTKPFMVNHKQRRNVLFANGISWYVDDEHGCINMVATDAKDGETWDADVYRIQVACRVLDQRP